MYRMCAENTTTDDNASHRHAVSLVASHLFTFCYCCIFLHQSCPPLVRVSKRHMFSQEERLQRMKCFLYRACRCSASTLLTKCSLIISPALLRYIYIYLLVNRKGKHTTLASGSNSPHWAFTSGFPCQSTDFLFAFFMLSHFLSEFSPGRCESPQCTMEPASTPLCWASHTFSVRIGRESWVHKVWHVVWSGSPLSSLNCLAFGCMA